MIVRQQKRAQIGVPLHWIYVLIAGTVILLFFVVIVARQKAVAEQELSLTVVNKLESIFTGAALSDQTVNLVEVPELKLEFLCEESGYAAYRIGSISREITHQPIFAPATLETARLITWSLEFQLPFKVTNLLMLSSPDVLLLVVYDPASPGMKERLERALPEQLNVRYVPIGSLSGAGIAADQVRLGFAPRPPQALPASLQQLPDARGSAIQLNADAVTFYKKRGSQLAYQEAVAVVGSFEENNPALLAALFTDDAVSYRCTMGKAFQRLALLAPIYEERTRRITAGYPPTDRCALLADPRSFARLSEQAASCTPLYQDSCTAVIELARAIRDQSTNMRQSNCPVLY